MALAYAFIERQAGFSIFKQVSKLLKFLRRAPRALEKIRSMIGELTPANLRKWAVDGKKALRRVLSNAALSFPLGIFFHPKTSLPTLTDLVNRIMTDTEIGKFLRAQVKPKVDSLDRLLERHLPNLRRPLLAAIFIFIWLNVTEVSWNFSDLMDGFTGAGSLSKLLSSLPESALGCLLRGFGLGFQIVPVVLLARFLWLVAHNYIEWNNGSFKVHWNLLGSYHVLPE